MPGGGSLATGSRSSAAGGSQPVFPAFSLDAELRYTDFNDVHAEVMRALYGAEIALTRRVAESLSERDPARRVVWTVQPGCRVVGDSELLEVVLDNLLGNAWKFTSENGEAHVEFGVRTVDGERAYFVRDDGAGFDPKYADKLFQPFQRLHTDEQFAGTGIGLARVRRAITRLGGRCWAEGAVGEGATFFFTLAGSPV